MSMSILLITVALILVSYAALSMIRPRRIEGLGKTVDLSITLVGTFAGVFIALSIAQWQRVHEEKRQLESYYSAAITDSKNISSDLTFRLQMAGALKDAVPGATPDQTSYFGLSAPHQPVILPQLLDAVELHRYFSPTLKNNLFSLVRSYDNITAAFRAGSNIATNEGVLRMMLKEVKFETALIETELKYLRGEINAEAVESAFQKLMVGRLPLQKRPNDVNG